jgi:hypothetical protein
MVNQRVAVKLMPRAFGHFFFGFEMPRRGNAHSIDHLASHLLERPSWVDFCLPRPAKTDPKLKVGLAQIEQAGLSPNRSTNLTR